LLTVDDPVWSVVDVVDGLDLSGFEAAYRADGSGGRPYDPRLMLTVILHCYRLGIRSPVQIAEACRARVDLRVVLGGRCPSDRTVAVFVGRHAAALADVFVQVLALCDRDGLVDVAVTATDGSPVRAAASLSANRTVAWVDEQSGVAREQLDWFTAVAADAADALDADTDLDAYVGLVCEQLPAQAGVVHRRLRKLQAAERVAAGRAAARRDVGAGERAARIARAAAWPPRHAARLADMITAQDAKVAAYAERAAAAQRRGRRPDGRAPTPPGQTKSITLQRQALSRSEQKFTDLRHADRVERPTARQSMQVNPTDPPSRIMKGKQGLAWVQATNLTIIVGRDQLILAGFAYDNGNDHGGLHPAIRLARTNCDNAGITTPMRAHLADGGYASTTTFNTPTDGILLIPTPTTTTDPTDPTDPPDLTLTQRSRQQMAARLGNPAGARLYRRRAGKVEPVFAQMFQHGGRNLHHRGQAAHTEITLMITTHNIGKYLTHRTITNRPHRTPPKPHDTPNNRRP
jgi:transposase